MHIFASGLTELGKLSGSQCQPASDPTVPFMDPVNEAHFAGRGRQVSAGNPSNPFHHITMAPNQIIQRRPNNH